MINGGFRWILKLPGLSFDGFMHAKCLRRNNFADVVVGPSLRWAKETLEADPPDDPEALRQLTLAVDVLQPRHERMVYKATKAKATAKAKAKSVR